MASEFRIEDRFRGETIELDFRVTRDGDPVNIGDAGVQLSFTAKTDAKQPDAKGILKTKGEGITVTDGPDGKARVRLAPEDTASLFMAEDTLDLTCKLKIQEPDADAYVLASGTIVLKRD
jgi:hypothetical protein